MSAKHTSPKHTTSRFRHDPYSAEGYISVSPASSSMSASRASSTPPLDSPLSNPLSASMSLNDSLASTQKSSDKKSQADECRGQDACDVNQVQVSHDNPATDFVSMDLKTLSGQTWMSSAPDLTVPGNWVELCVGQVPFFVTKDMVGALLKQMCPGATLYRCMIHTDAKQRSKGLCFVVMKDNGAAQALIAKLHQRMWFNDDKSTACIALNGKAEKALVLLSRRRTQVLNRGEALPLNAMTVAWSRNPCNNAKYGEAEKALMLLSRRNRGEALPLNAMTVAWSRNPCNNKYRPQQQPAQHHCPMLPPSLLPATSPMAKACGLIF